MENMPQTIDETDKIIENIINKLDRIKHGSELYDKLLIDKTKYMEHRITLEKPKHQSWSDDLDIIYQYILEPSPERENKSNNHNYILLKSHPYYNLALNEKGEENIKARKKFVNDAFKSALTRGEDIENMMSMLYDLLISIEIEEQFMKSYASKKFNKIYYDFKLN